MKFLLSTVTLCCFFMSLQGCKRGPTNFYAEVCPSTGKIEIKEERGGQYVRSRSWNRPKVIEDLFVYRGYYNRYVPTTSCSKTYKLYLLGSSSGDKTKDNLFQYVYRSNWRELLDNVDAIVMFRDMIKNHRKKALSVLEMMLKPDSLVLFTDVQGVFSNKKLTWKDKWETWDNFMKRFSTERIGKSYFGYLKDPNSNIKRRFRLFSDRVISPGMITWKLPKKKEEKPKDQQK